MINISIRTNWDLEKLFRIWDHASRPTSDLRLHFLMKQAMMFNLNFIEPVDGMPKLFVIDTPDGTEYVFQSIDATTTDVAFTIEALRMVRDKDVAMLATFLEQAYVE